MANADLFGRLDVISADADAPATCIDVGWTAWRTAAPAPDAGRRKRWRFWWQLWRHIGRARYLVQVDDHYQLATGVRIRQSANGDTMEVRLTETPDAWRSLLRHCLAGRRSSSQATLLSGREVHVSRYPAGLTSAAVPDVSILGLAPCPEALIDGKHAAALPLQIRSTR